MVVRVRIRIETSRGVKCESVALLNSGYEAETPQILIPVRLAEELGYWPPSPGTETEFETAGGPLRVWMMHEACKVKVIAEDASSPEVEADVIISPIADEILISDKLIGKLQLSLEDVGEGLWRFRWEPKEKLRKSYPPKYWK